MKAALRPVMHDQIIVNLRVYWIDPDASLCSGWGYIDRIDSYGSAVDADTIIHVRKDDGGEVECLPHELRLGAAS